MIVAIDASRCRSGGAISHLVGLLKAVNVALYNIEEIHIWAPKPLLEKIPENINFFKHSPDALQKNIFHQLLWQATELKSELLREKCDILFSADASSLCNFSPAVVLSQDLLAYEPGVMQSYRWGLARLRLEIIKRIQNRAFQRAAGVLFLTKYARELVQTSCGQLVNTALAPHGIDESFRNTGTRQQAELNMQGEPIHCVYVSNTDLYKHQWNVVKAVRILRDKGHIISLTLIGGGTGIAREVLDRAIYECDGDGWVTQLEFLPHSDLPVQLDQADIFVFASSCENLPITLLEGMAMGLPIACSDRGPMPEVLGNGGVYFDPHNCESIAEAIKRLVESEGLRNKMTEVAVDRAMAYSWENCSRATFDFISDCYFQGLQSRR